MCKAVVAGHICLDITPLFPAEHIGKEISDFLFPGKLVQMKEADIHTGGVVSNTGLAMNLLGADVTLMAKTGDDPFGRMITDILDQHSARYFLTASAAPTSYTVVIAPPGIDRIFLHNPGANDTFVSDDLDYEKIREAELFHFGYPPTMRKMYENDGSELVKIFRKVKELGVVTSLDMVLMDPDSDAGRADWETILEKVLPYTDFFMPSIEEFLFMLNRKRFLEISARNRPDIEKDIDPLAGRLMEYGAKGVIVKCGEPGIYYRFSDAENLAPVSDAVGRDVSDWGERTGFVESYKPDTVLSATGAGDTAIAGFLTAFLKGCTLDDCLDMAAAAGASCVEAWDALSGLKSFDELDKKIKNGWERV